MVSGLTHSDIWLLLFNSKVKSNFRFEAAVLTYGCGPVPEAN